MSQVAAASERSKLAPFKCLVAHTCSARRPLPSCGFRVGVRSVRSVGRKSTPARSRPLETRTGRFDELGASSNLGPKSARLAFERLSPDARTPERPNARIAATRQSGPIVRLAIVQPDVRLPIKPAQNKSQLHSRLASHSSQFEPFDALVKPTSGPIERPAKQCSPNRLKRVAIVHTTLGIERPTSATAAKIALSSRLLLRIVKRASRAVCFALASSSSNSNFRLGIGIRIRIRT